MGRELDLTPLEMYPFPYQTYVIPQGYKSTRRVDGLGVWIGGNMKTSESRVEESDGKIHEDALRNTETKADRD